jgi:hypothetical protein
MKLHLGTFFFAQGESRIHVRFQLLREFEQMEIEYFISPEDDVWPVVSFNFCFADSLSRFWKNGCLITGNGLSGWGLMRIG